jgi:alpha-galactosidase
LTIAGLSFGGETACAEQTPQRAFADCTLFDTRALGREFIRFQAEGFPGTSACGVVYRLRDRVTNGMPLGGIDTGCIDLETNGMLGYATVFNTHVPRRGPMNTPILGLSVGGRTWVLCDPKPHDGEGCNQPSVSGRDYTLWRDGQYRTAKDLLTPVPTKLRLEGVRTAKEIHYWGHYPVADLEFETDAPVQVGLRAWTPFLPGDLIGSMLPGAVLELRLRNPTAAPQSGTIAFSFPGPLEKEAGGKQFARKQIAGELGGVEVTAPLASYALGAIGEKSLRLGGDLGLSGQAWSKIDKELPAAAEDHAGASAAVDFSLAAGECRVVRFVLAWHAPTWNAGGYNWAGVPHTFTHMYAKHYRSAREVAEILARNHESLLKRILAWQAIVYADESLPIWLRESLVNVLHLITETGMWAQAKPPLPAWVRADDGLFGMNECPRGCPQLECMPCSFYGNQPLVYFFPELALSSLRGYKGYHYPDGAAVWIFGGVTGGTPPIDFVNPTRGYQFATNGVSLAGLVDRYLMCCNHQRQAEVAREFWPMIKQNMIYTVNLRPSYLLGDRIIAISKAQSGSGVEWFEMAEPGWYGMTAHVGGLHLAQLRIAERIARLAGDAAFAEQCAQWSAAGAKSMNDKLWTGSYYLNFLEPETGRRSDLVFGYQLDGQWITDHHGLPPALPLENVRKTLETIKRCNIKLSRSGAVNWAKPDGSPRGGVANLDPSKGTWDYGSFSYFPPEALMLAMTYMYQGEREYGLELARKVWHNIECIQGYTWDMPNIMRGDADTGERTYGNDYYQDMMLWSLPAAIAGRDFAAPTEPGGLVSRMIRAARQTQAHGSAESPAAETAPKCVDILLRETPAGQEVRYVSGNTVCLERLRAGRWEVGGWSAQGHSDFPQPWQSNAFELRVKDRPTPSTVPGTLLSDGWQWLGLAKVPATEAGTVHAAVRLRHGRFPVEIALHTTVDGTPILVRWLEITNRATKPMALTGCMPWCGRLWSTAGPVSLGHSLRWDCFWEGWFGWTPLKPGANVFQQDRGLTWDDPYFVLRNEAAGEYFFGQLAWPANFLMEFFNDEGVAFKAGPLARNALRVLAPGETISTPAVHLGCVKGDFDQAVQAMHVHVRRSVLPPQTPDKRFRVQYIHPEDQPLTVYRGAAYNEASVKTCMDVAAAAGMELFIVDGPTWCSAYGNWLEPDRRRFPQGLKPLVDYAHRKGLLFGLYAEPEGGREGYTSVNNGATIGPWSRSKVFQEHRDWFVQPQSVLNLAIPEAAAYMEAELGRIIEHYGLDLYRHDFNAPQRGEGSATDRDGFLECDYWRHYETLGNVMTRVRGKYPNVILQQASAGGTRLELDTLARWHEDYTSDRVSYPEVYRMLSGLSVYLPPEILVAPHGMAGNGKDQPDLPTMLRGAYALGNTPMIFNAMLPKSVEEFNPGERELWQRYSQLYRTFMRPLLATSRVYHHAPASADAGVESGDWFAMEFAAPDRSKGWATVIRLSRSGPDTYLLKPKGLDPARTYEVTRDNLGKTETVSGAVLSREGVNVHVPTRPLSELLLFETR